MAGVVVDVAHLLLLIAPAPISSFAPAPATAAPSLDCRSPPEKALPVRFPRAAGPRHGLRRRRRRTRGGWPGATLGAGAASIDLGGGEILGAEAADESAPPMPSTDPDLEGTPPALEDGADRRPHEQRVSGPRKARRLNHPFQHLHRHPDPRWGDGDWSDDDEVSTEIRAFHDGLFSENVTSEEAFGKGRQFNSTFAQQPVDVRTSLSAIRYLHDHGGYSLDEIRSLRKRFPPLLEMDAERHLRPKTRFLRDCLGGAAVGEVTGGGEDGTRAGLDPGLRSSLPPSYFGSRLERTVAPRHAFLMHLGLPAGRELWLSTTDVPSSITHGGGDGGGRLLEEFLSVHRNAKRFAAACNAWRNKFGSKAPNDGLPITAGQVAAFDKLFQRGILSAARDDSAYVHPDETNRSGSDKKGRGGEQPSLLQTANVTSSQLVRYLIRHGANPWETDVRGASLFHWAAGCGNLDGLKELVEGCDTLGFVPKGVLVYGNNEDIVARAGAHAALLWKADRDGATPLHWAAAGAGPKEFGIGGNVDVCSYLLSLRGELSISVSERELINSRTKDGNTVLMWAAWSRSLDVVKLLVRSRANVTASNRNGCTVAHWAASGGDLAVCKYLYELANVNFEVENHARNTPLSHAVAYGRYDVAKWLREDLRVDDDGGTAEDLALDFFNWAESGAGMMTDEEEAERREVYSIFNSLGDWRSEGMGVGNDDKWQRQMRKC